ncbi:hypothetical protein ACN6KF_005248 [Labrys sp. La1]|uniref:hypothetical protein n=1 Tax=Labrys sp. La1 TaxID=3404917 RepID=UPI003EB6C4F4
MPTRPFHAVSSVRRQHTKLIGRLHGVQFALPSRPLKWLSETLDPINRLQAVGRQKPDDFIGLVLLADRSKPQGDEIANPKNMYAHPLPYDSIVFWNGCGTAAAILPWIGFQRSTKQIWKTKMLEL